MTVIDCQPTRAPAGRLARPDRLALAVGAIVAAGLALRLCCAGGPLWLDEIWSIENLAPLSHYWQVFWGISHDNNHFLNSLWLYFAAPAGAGATILRAPSIAMGALAIAMMARLGARHSPAAALAAAAMTALSYFFVNYSVESRGYAGSALALLVGFDALERAIERPQSRARFTLAAAMGIGLLWHLAILPAIGLFGLFCLFEERRRRGGFEPALAATMRVFAPTAVAAIPAFACVFAGIAVVGTLTIGGLRGFDAAQALGAIAEMARDAIGVSPAAPAAAVVAAGAAAVGIALIARLVLDGRRLAYAIILLGLPAAVFVLRPPNAHIPRYYLVCALFLILLLAECFGSLWRAGSWRRWGALAALAAILAGDAGLVLRFQDSKQTAWPLALDAIAASGQLRLASSFDDRVGKLVAYYDRDHPALELVPRAQWCQKRPQWFVAETAGIAELPATLDLAAGQCRVPFALVRRYETWGLSSVGWALYRAP
jgi:hypothetical protein